MNPSHATAEILGKEPALTWIWLIYGSVALGGLLLCRRKARWLALALPLSLIVSVTGIGELCNLGASLYNRSPLYYVQWCIGIALALLCPVGGAAYCLCANQKERMKAAIWLGAAALFCALAVLRAVVSGTTAMFLMTPGVRVTADHQRVSGWVHREIRGYGVVITRNDGPKPESYLVNLPFRKGAWVRDCGAWAASRFPVLTMADYGPPCSSTAPAQDWRRSLANQNLVVAPRFIEFTTDDDGKRLRISW